MENKTCKHCNETKQIEEFKSSRSWYCNDCQTSVEKIRKEKSVAYATKYNQQNKISYNQYRREYTKRPEVRNKMREYQNKKYKENEDYRVKALAGQEKHTKIKNIKPIYLIFKNQKPIYYIKHELNAKKLCEKHGYEYQEIYHNIRELG